MLSSLITREVVDAAEEDRCEAEAAIMTDRELDVECWGWEGVPEVVMDTAVDPVWDTVEVAGIQVMEVDTSHIMEVVEARIHRRVMEVDTTSFPVKGEVRMTTTVANGSEEEVEEGPISTRHWQKAS